MHFVWASSESPAKLAQPLQEPRTAAATASPPEAAPKLPLCLEDDDASGKIVARLRGWEAIKARQLVAGASPFPACIPLQLDVEHMPRRRAWQLEQTVETQWHSPKVRIPSNHLPGIVRCGARSRGLDDGVLRRVSRYRTFTDFTG